MEAEMAIVIIQEPPIQLSAEMYDATSSRMDIDGNPPDGLISHTAGADRDGQWRIIDVWESQDAFERFRSERLLPAIAETAREFGVDPGEGPKITAYEAHHVLVPAAAHTHA
jgi:hypothetical protein